MKPTLKSLKQLRTRLNKEWPHLRGKAYELKINALQSVDVQIKNHPDIRRQEAARSVKATLARMR